MRPHPRPIFLTGNRRPIVFFQTSNDQKFWQAQLVFEKSGLQLNRFRGPKARSLQYAEDYSVTSADLLRTGLAEVVKAVGAQSFVFIEDTSLRIDALSSPSQDVPGLMVKEWFSTGQMRDIAQRIRGEVLDPSATVKSDIALHVPGLKRPILFHGETKGQIAVEAPTFEAQPHYPWLSPDTFNGWFIPIGEKRRLGEMSIEQSWKHDFRIKSLSSLIDRLEEYAYATNAPAQAVARRTGSTGARQPTLFETDAPSPQGVAVIGKTCAGKTTVGEYLARHHGVFHIEASAILRTIEGEGLEDDLGAFQFANLALTRYGFAAVADRLIELYGDALNEPFVVSGLRTLEELVALKRFVPWMRVLLLEADEATRYERWRLRPRDEMPPSLEAFRRRDEEHAVFGLLPVAHHICDIVLPNEASFSDLYARVDEFYAKADGRRLPSPDRSSQLARVLEALDDAARPCSPAEIEAITKGIAHQVKRNAVRKVLSSYPRLTQRSKVGNTFYYELNESGRSYLILAGVKAT